MRINTANTILKIFAISGLITVGIILISIYQFSKVEALTCNFGSSSDGINCVGFVSSTSATSWPVPTDWINVSNTIEVIGGGGGSASGTVGKSGSGAHGGAGGGGGAGGNYAEYINFNVGASTSIPIQVGAGGVGGNGVAAQTGSSTWFHGNTCAGSSVCASGGGGANGTTGGATTTGSVGSNKNYGGPGGAGGAIPSGTGGSGGGGGGGAAGFSGNGVIGADGSSTSGTSGGLGGGGGAGDNGNGGAGGAPTAPGFCGNEWGSTYGSGGGAGGSTGGASASNGQNGIGSNNYPNGTSSCGLPPFGAGASGGSGPGKNLTPGLGATGYGGLVVITYTPAVTTIGNGTNPPDVTIRPGAAPTSSDIITFKTSASSTPLTSVTTTWSSNATSGIALVEFVDSASTTVYGSVSNPVSSTFVISLSGLTVATTTKTFMLRITPKSTSTITNGNYIVTSTVTAWTDSPAFTHAGSDAGGNTITIDASPPGDVTNASSSAASGVATTTWTNPTGDELNSILVIRGTSTMSGISPQRGVTYSAGNSLATSTVTCVTASSTSPLACTDTGVVNGTTYYYKLFAYDNFQNYSTGTVTNSVTPNAATISVSGTCKLYDEVTNCSDGEKVMVAFNATLQSSSSTTSGGLWAISGLTQPSAGDVITVFTSGTAASARTAAITKYVSGNVTGMQLDANHLTLGSANNQTITNADISKYDNGVNGTNDVFFNVDASNNLSVDTTGLLSNPKLLVLSGNTFQPDSSGAKKVITAANFTNKGAATMNGTITRLSGSFTNAGTFNAGTSTFEFSSSSAVIDNSGGTFYDLTASSSATATATSSFTVTDALNIVGTFNINTGVTTTIAATTTLTGTIGGSGNITFNATSTGPGTSGTLNAYTRFDATNGNISSTTIPVRTYGGAVDIYSSTTSNNVIKLASGTYTLNSGLNIIANGSGNITLEATSSNPAVTISGSLDFTGAGVGSKIIQSGSGTWTVGGTADFTGGTYTASIGNTLLMNGVGTLNTNNNILQNLQVNSNSAGHVTFAANTTTTVAGNLLFGGTSVPVTTNTTITMTSASATIDGGGDSVNNFNVSSTGSITLQNTDLTVAGTLTIPSTATTTINSGRILTIGSGGALTLNGNIFGSGTLAYQPATTFPSSGSVSSTLRFDVTTNSQTMPNRSYGGAIQAVNSGSSNQTLTMASGNYSLLSDLLVIASSTGNIILDGSANNVSTTITGSLLENGSGGGAQNIKASSSNWTVAGAVAIANSGTFTAPTGTLYIGGNYTNNGTFTHSTGTVVLNGTGQQILSGTLSGSSALYNLFVTNHSGSDAMQSPSVKFNATTTLNTIAASSTVGFIRLMFLATTTLTAQSINFYATPANFETYLRSSVTSTPFFLNVAATGTQSVSGTDVRDSNASLGDQILAYPGTGNINSGGNTNWAFSTTSPSVSSTANDTFSVNGASTTVSNITVTSGAGQPDARITTTNGIRLVILGTFNATWDPSVTSITCASGTACSKTSTTVTYEATSTIAVIPVLANWNIGDTATISGLKMGNFTSAVASSSAIGVRVDGSGDASTDATDPVGKTIKGTLALQDHGAGQVSNQFTGSQTSMTGVTLFRYRLVPTGEPMNIGTTTINLSSVAGFASSDITNTALYQDSNSNGTLDAGEAEISASGTVYIVNGSGTIVLPSAGGTSGWWNTNWQKRIKITFSGATTTESEANFPVLVQLNSSRINYANTNASGTDIRFIDPDNNTQLNYEIEKWDTTATSSIWVKANHVSSTQTDFMYMYYNNPNATSTASSTATWDSSYAAVWHLKEATGSNNNDSTANGYTGIPETASGGANPVQTTSIIDGGLGYNCSLSGTACHNTMGYTSTSLRMDVAAASNNSTISWWMYPQFSPTDSNDYVFWGQRGQLAAPYFSCEKYSDNKWYCGWNNGTDHRVNINATASNLTQGVWQYYALTTVGGGSGSSTLYRNGVSIGTTANVGVSSTMTGAFNFGAVDEGTHGFYGTTSTIDEFRIASTTRSQAYLWDDYYSGSDQLNTYNAAETAQNFKATSTTDVLLVANVSNINTNNTITLSLPSANINATGATSTLAITLTGSATNATHTRPGPGNGGGGGGAEGSPPSVQPQGGGGSGGGGGGSESTSTPTTTPQGGGGSGGGGGGSAMGNPMNLLASLIDSLGYTLNKILEYFR